MYTFSDYFGRFNANVYNLIMTSCLSILDEDLPNDPYMNYLKWPRIHFSGTFRADTSTINNWPDNYDTKKFTQADELPNKEQSNWNPGGTNEWSVDGFVTRVCYADGTCVGHDEYEANKDTVKKAEPLMAAPILGMLYSSEGPVTDNTAVQSIARSEVQKGTGH